MPEKNDSISTSASVDSRLRRVCGSNRVVIEGAIGVLRRIEEVEPTLHA